ncbi:MAG: PDC sensor domain-containing protein [Gammaproteobacteria bacterium]|nr:PDC sensor domain-containing protein [Gammaproteobacteria bacterium]
MQVSSSNLKETIRLQREMLIGLLGEPMHDLAMRCAEVIDSRIALETLLTNAFPVFSYCKHLYVLNADAIQITDNIIRQGVDHEHFGRDRTERPYMQDIIGTTDFKLSEAYISRNKKRPSLTAIQVIRNRNGEHVGFLGADFDTRELPHSENGYTEPDDWRQIKGDPAIRSGVFLSRRIDSLMDKRLDEVLSVMNELIAEHGVFHGKLHFSSNRATIWTVDDPFVYRFLGIDELTDPDICLAYPGRPYHKRAIVPVEQVMPVFDMFRKLRFADDNVYLRAGSLNIINGMVGLNFSCDGSHYMRYDEFLDKSTDFWFGL